jgi:general secretion pathway protein D
MNPYPRNDAAPARRGALLLTALLSALLAPGCEYLGPAGAKKLKIPQALVIQTPQTREERPAPPAPVENPGATSVEIYPPQAPLLNAAQTPIAPARRAKEGKYTLNFEDADLAEVAKVILGDTVKVNYVISPKVTGKVSLQTARPLADDELIPTLEMLLKANGAVLIKERGSYRIEPEANAVVNAPAARLSLSGRGLEPGYQLRVVPLRYVGALEMQKVIEPMLPPKSVLRADETRNLLLLAGSSEDLESALETIRIFDVDFMRGMSVGLYPLKNVDAPTIADELDKLLTVSGKGPLTGMFRLMPIERLNAILAVTPQPRYLDEVQTWIERLDRYNTNKSGNMHVYRVQNVDAIELANTLSQIFGQAGRSRTPGASLSPGLSGGSISGGGMSGGFTDGDGDRLSSSGFGGSSSSSGVGGGIGSTGTGSSLGGGGINRGATGTGSLGSSGAGSSATGTSGGAFGGGFGGGAAGGGGSTGRGRARTGAQVADLGNNMRIVADPSNNALIIMAKAQEYREIESVIKELDIMPLQVLIDATIVEVTLTDQLQYGLRWYFEHSQNNGQLTGAGVLNSPASELVQTAEKSALGGFTYSLVNSSKHIRIELDALAALNKTNILSAPSLMVLNNQQASIKVGDSVPILNAQALPTAGVTNLVGTQSIQYRDTGVQLDVRPRVNAGGLVIMEVKQAVDDVKNAASTGLQSPTIAQRQIVSSVAVKNGETIVLGGLIRENVSNSKNGIPLLSAIPVLGALFSQTNKKLDRTELMIMITPRVVENSTASREIANEFRRRLTGLYEQSPAGK